MSPPPLNDMSPPPGLSPTPHVDGGMPPPPLNPAEGGLLTPTSLVDEGTPHVGEGIMFPGLLRTTEFQNSQCFSSPRAPDRGYGLCIYVSTGHAGYDEEADIDRAQTLANRGCRHLGIAEEDSAEDGGAAPNYTCVALWLGPLFMKPGAEWLQTDRERRNTLGYLPGMGHVNRRKINRVSMKTYTPG